MTKIDIISGFLGAGKTTFIKKLLEDIDRTYPDYSLYGIDKRGLRLFDTWMPRIGVNGVLFRQRKVVSLRTWISKKLQEIESM